MRAQAVTPAASCLLILAIACAPPPEEEAPVLEGAVSTQADLEAVRALLDEYVAAENAGDVERILALTTDDGWASPPGEPPITGKEAWRSWWEDLYAEYNLQGNASDVEIQAFGSWGFIRGIWDATLTPKEGGEPQTSSYSFIVIVRRDADDTWKQARAMWNRNAPAPGGEQ